MLYIEISRARDRTELVTDDKAALREQIQALIINRFSEDVDITLWPVHLIDVVLQFQRKSEAFNPTYSWWPEFIG